MISFLVIYLSSANSSFFCHEIYLISFLFQIKGVGKKQMSFYFNGSKSLWYSVIQKCRMTASVAVKDALNFHEDMTRLSACKQPHPMSKVGYKFIPARKIMLKYLLAKYFRLLTAQAALSFDKSALLV